MSANLSNPMKFLFSYHYQQYWLQESFLCPRTNPIVEKIFCVLQLCSKQWCINLLKKIWRKTITEYFLDLLQNYILGSHYYTNVIIERSIFPLRYWFSCEIVMRCYFPCSWVWYNALISDIDNKKVQIGDHDIVLFVFVICSLFVISQYF